VSTTVIIWILTALAAVVVVLTRLRLRGEQGAGRYAVSSTLLNLHTVCGTLAWIAWVTFLLAGEDTPFGGPMAGIVAIGLWWVTAICGLLLLMRWLPSRGRHATGATTDSWSEGPGLSVLAHVGLVVGVAVFTGAYLTGAV
jgi:hypothetical protein